MKKVSLKVLSLAISLVLMLSVFAPAVSAGLVNDEHKHSEDINYVSLGDSMSNGYGLDGYNGNNGVYDYGNASYANQFAGWLDALIEGDVNHAQLAMSAMRAEDLHWLLEVDYENAEVQNVINTLATNGWDADLWYSVFTNGDYWTWKELVNDYRFDIAAAYIEGLEGAPNYSQVYAKYTDLEALKIVAAEYQNSVENADIVSLGMGNGNFGVFMFGRILEATGFNGTPDKAMVYDVQDAIRELDPKQQEIFNDLIDELFAALEENGFVVDDGDDTVTSKNEALVNTVVYTAVSYVLNYAGSVEAMLQLNPDAEIILVALMNTFAEEDGLPSELADLSIGDMLDVVFEPLNAFIAALPTYMQLTQNSVYADATFYFAEAANVECIVDTYKDEVYNRSSIVFDRFYQDIANGMIWGLLEGESFAGATIVDITPDEIKDYEAKTYADKAAYAVDNSDKAASIAVYLAFEKAVIATADAPVTVNSILDLKLDASAFAPVIAGVTSADVSMVEDIADIYAAIAAMAGMSVDQLQDLLSNNFDNDSVERVATQLAPVPAYVSAIAAEILNQKDTITSAVTLLTLPEVLATVLENSSVAGLLGLFGRCVVGNGLGGHPSEAGHNTLAAAVIAAYDEEYTAQNETIKNLIIIRDLIVEYYDEAYAYAYDKAEEEGLIILINEYLDAANLAIDEADAWVLAHADYIRSAEFANALNKASLDARATIEAARALINNADELDAESFDYLMKLLATLEADVVDIANLLNIAVMDAGHYLDPKIAALKAQADKQIAILKAELENAAEEAKAAILAEIARVEAAVDAEIAKLVAAYNAAIAEIKAIPAKIEAAINDAIDAVNTIIAEADRYVKESLNEIYEQLAEILSDSLAIAGDYLYRWVIEHPEVVAKLLVKYGDDIVEALIIYHGDVIEAYKPIIEAAFSGEYTITEDSFYLAIGDSVFADLLAGELNLADKYAINGWDDISYNTIKKADLITVAIDENDYSGFAIEQVLGYIADYLDGDLRDSLNAYVEAAFAEFFSNCAPTPSVELQAKIIDTIKAYLNGSIDDINANYLGGASAVEMDWAALVGEDNVAYVDDAREAMKNYIINSGVPEVISEDIPVLALLLANADKFDSEVASYINGFESDELTAMFGEYANYTLEVPAADALTFAGESYMFGYAQFSVNYANTIKTINAINPDATVVVLGNYNAFAGVEFYGIDLGALYADFAKATSAEALGLAVMYENVVYVDILDAETVLATSGIDSFEDFVVEYLMNPSITDVSVAGSEYIVDQILAAVAITDTRCVHEYEDDGDCTTAVLCTKCGTVIVEANEAHTGGTATCTEKAKCDVCGKEYGELAAHTPNADDGDCTTAITCKDCGAVTTAANTHTGGTATCTEKAKCSACGKAYGELAAHTPNADDGDCTTAITCKDCGAVTTAAKSAHTGGTATCTAKAKCSVCAKEYGELAVHTPNADDGNCTTAITCSKCGAVTTAAASAHTFGEWVVVKEATEAEAGERQRTCSACGTVEKEAIAKLEPAATTTPATTTPVTTTGIDDEKDGLGAGAIVAISIASAAVLGAGGFAIYWFVIQKKTWAEFLLIFKR